MLKGLSKTVVIIIIIVVLLIFHYAGLLKWVETPLLSLFSPVQKLAYDFGLAGYSFFHSYSQCHNLAIENDELLGQLTGNDIDQMRLSELERENQYLRSELEFIKSKEANVLLAKIVSKPLLQNDLFIIDKGSEHGVQVGQAVLAEQGILVGKVFSVDKLRSRVALLTNSKSTIAVTLNNNAHTQGVVQGNMGLGLLMDLIPPEENINVGDLVYSSGLEEMIGQNYLIGRIANILSGDTDLYQKAEVLPSMDYRQLKILTVVLTE